VRNVYSRCKLLKEGLFHWVDTLFLSEIMLKDSSFNWIWLFKVVHCVAISGTPLLQLGSQYSFSSSSGLSFIMSYCENAPR